MTARKPYPSDVSDEEWALVAPYLTLLPEGAGQREHPLREVFDGLRYVVRHGIPWRAMPNDLPPWHAVYDQAQRWLRAGCRAGQPHAALDARERPAGGVGRVQAHPRQQGPPRRGHAGGQSVELAYVDQGYAGERAEGAAAAHGIRLEVVKLPDAKRGFVLLPRRWVVERSFAWMARCRRLARDYERLPTTLAGLHVVAFVILMLRRAADLALVHNSL